MAKNKSSDKSCECGCGSHMKGHGTCALLVGLAVIANAYWAVTSWAMFVGIIVALGGLAKIFMHPKCNCK